MHKKHSVRRGLLGGLLLLLLGTHSASADEGPPRSALAKPAAAPAPTEAPALAPTAQPSTAPATAIGPEQPDKDGYVPDNRPMNGPTVDESIPAAPLLATAYGFVWLAVLGYVVMVGKGLRRVESDLDELSDKLGKLSTKS